MRSLHATALIAGLSLLSFGACQPTASEPEPQHAESATSHPGATPPSDDVAVPSSGSERLSGIDVSHFDKTIDWSQVAAHGIHFTFIKATEGIDLVDPAFATNWPGAKAAGLVRGAYHFFRPDDDAETQARFFLDTVQHATGDLPPVLDVEITKDKAASSIIEGVATWLRIVESAVGVQPILYTSPHFWEALGTDAFSTHPLWIAQYETDAPTVPLGWTAWTFWQHSQDETVAGIETPVDLNHFAGDHRAMAELLLP